jgi:putative endonuclease
VRISLFKFQVMNYYVYIMSNPARTVLYTGVTNDLERRVQSHKLKLEYGFTRRYNCVDLVYFEDTDNSYSAIEREKQIKKMRRAKKETLIDVLNKDRVDLSANWNI